MKKISLISIASLMALASFASVQAAEHEIKMLNSGADGSMVFEPGYLKVAPGDTVNFVATDASHDSVSVAIPAGAKGWKGEMSKAVSVTLDKEGVYLYKCTPHTAHRTPHTVMAMVGVIQVGKPTNLEEAKQAAAQMSAGFVMNKDRLDKYMAQVK